MGGSLTYRSKQNASYLLAYNGLLAYQKDINQ